jgi:hypothetical protein
VDKLEDFCCSGQFTQFLQEFGQTNGNKFTDESEEQSIECYTLWQDFKREIDIRLESFLEAELPGMSSEAILEKLQRV